MAQEIERKFVVEEHGDWRNREGVFYRQGYICNSRERSVRVRTAGDAAYLTVKGKTTGATRAEFEYSIPLSDAEELLETLCQPPLIEKTRRVVEYEGKTWEVDEFYGENKGLIVAEIELDDEAEHFARPPWLGLEVTDDPRYYNANLVNTPYSQWSKT